eukprot:CAMPEP_0115755064 /NCGR_PEP_ID=MMETSP0272-20121206/97195_1 /TAXON_ID=71861 /ORGANISM="Scrippsiella trochoidea, Strain CCMP3099" /LENGTH=54 /DNA_ID=CAMNT_0003200495 /DNA_START=173 /DNA_END=333 /DNA_ORIENTATION=+
MLLQALLQVEDAGPSKAQYLMAGRAYRDNLLQAPHINDSGGAVALKVARNTSTG